MNSLTTTSVRPSISAHRTRRVVDAVVSAYLREISAPQPVALHASAPQPNAVQASAFQPAPERPVIRVLDARDVVAEPSVERACERPRIRIRRWAPPERRGPLEAAA